MMKTARVLFAVFLSLCLISAAIAGESENGGEKENQPEEGAVQEARVEISDGGPAFHALERIETVLYGAPQSGGLLDRLDRAETGVFGRPLPGSLTERQTAMMDFMERGTAAQPSLLFKLAVAEWGVEREIHPGTPMSRRVEAMESMLEGAVQRGPLAARIERIIARLLPEGVLATPVDLPANTVVKAELAKTLTVRTTKADDKIVLRLASEIIAGDTVVAPKGSRVFAHVTKVKPPRSFGRASEIEMAFDALEVLGPSTLAVTMGERAKKAMEADASVIGAVGASFGGAVLLGPLGLAGGFLVRGSDKQLKEGTLFYVETAGKATVNGYAVPPQISSMVASGDDYSPQGGSEVNP